MTADLSAPDGHRIELVGELAGILGLASGGQIAGGATGRRGARMRKPRRLAGADVSSESVTMVAGIGFEPMTFRL